MHRQMQPRFKDAMENGSKEIFSKTSVTFYPMRRRVKTILLQRWNKVKETAAPQDMFAFFITLAMVLIKDAKNFSWRLTMHCGAYLVTMMMMRWPKGIKGRTIAEFSIKEIKAQKQLFILDAR